MSDVTSKFIQAYAKVKNFYNGGNKYAVFQQLLKEQYLDKATLEQLQVDRFNKLWKHTVDNSPFYKNQLKEYSLPQKISSLSELALFPCLKRENLQNNGEEIIIKTDTTCYADSSGGSSGVPVNFYHDASYKMYGEALYLLFLSWMDVQEGEKTGVFWGADIDFSEWTFKEKLRLKINRLQMLNSFNVEQKTLDLFLDNLQKFNPDFIYGYASSLYLAAERINQNSSYNFRPKSVRATAEMLYDFQRKEIEKAFNCSVFNFYGSREVNNLAAECASHEGMHVFSSGRILEIVDKEGKNLPDGEVGYIVITDLTNFSFPFIRYMNGDMASISSKLCSCGRSYPLLQGIAGRESDILKFGDRFVHSEFFAHLFYQQPSVKQFQIIQESATELVVKIATENKDMDVSEIQAKISKQIGESVRIEIQFVDEIKSLKSGKFRFTINKTVKEKK